MMVQVDLFLTLIPKIMKKASLNFILFFLFLQYSNASTKSILLVDLDGDGTKDFVTIAQDNKTQFNKINWRGYYGYFGYYGSPENSLFERAITLYPYSVISSTYDNALKSAIEESIQLYHWQNYWNSSTQVAAGDYIIDQITYLYASDKGISGLSGIEQLSNLQYAYLGGNNFKNEDLNYLFQLTSLINLDISEGGKLTSIEGIQKLTNLYFLELEGQKLTSLKPFLEMTNLKYIDIKENYINLADSDNIADLKTLRRNGVDVDITPQVPISVQNLSGQMLIRENSFLSSPNDPKANFIYAFEQLLNLLEEDDASSLKQVAIKGGAAASLINFSLPDLWRNDLDYEDNSELNSDADLSQIEDFMVDVFIPRLTVINSHFSKMATHDGTILLTQDFTGKEDTIEVDSGDAYMMMAFVEALKAFVQTISSYDWDYNLKELEGLDDDELVNLETLLAPSDRFVKFGRLKSSNQLIAAKGSFKNAIRYYESGADRMRERLGQSRLLEMSTDDLDDEEELRSDLNEFRLALDNQHNLDKSSTQDIISLNALFSGNFDPANQLPEAVGEKFVMDQVTDPTFGGLFPNWTQSIISQYAKDENLVTEDAIEGAADVAGAPNWKRAGWLGFFYAPNREAGAKEFWMFHGLLGWSYLKAESPTNIWIYYLDTNEWFWTKSSEFPNLYRNNNQNWYYLNAYQSFLTWNNNTWSSTNL